MKGKVGGKGNSNSGRKGAGVEYNLLKNYNKYQDVFWQKLGTFFESTDRDEQKFAIQEFNKIQVRMIPQKLAGVEDEPLSIKVNYKNESLDIINEIINEKLNAGSD